MGRAGYPRIEIWTQRLSRHLQLAIHLTVMGIHAHGLGMLQDIEHLLFGVKMRVIAPQVIVTCRPFVYIKQFVIYCPFLYGSFSGSAAFRSLISDFMFVPTFTNVRFNTKQY